MTSLMLSLSRAEDGLRRGFDRRGGILVECLGSPRSIGFEGPFTGDVQMWLRLDSFNSKMLLRGVYAEADMGYVYERGGLVD